MIKNTTTSRERERLCCSPKKFISLLESQVIRLDHGMWSFSLSILHHTQQNQDLLLSVVVPIWFFETRKQREKKESLSKKLIHFSLLQTIGHTKRRMKHEMDRQADKGRKEDNKYHQISENSIPLIWNISDMEGRKKTKQTTTTTKLLRLFLTFDVCYVAFAKKDSHEKTTRWRKRKQKQKDDGERDWPDLIFPSSCGYTQTLSELSDKLKHNFVPSHILITYCLNIFHLISSFSRITFKERENTYFKILLSRVVCELKNNGMEGVRSDSIAYTPFW